jgi:hypothetical protein
MTTTDTPNKFRYQGNGVTNTFAFPGRVYAATDLVVESVTRATDALEETLTINTDYTVTILSTGTASVDVTNALKVPDSTQDIILRRVLPQSQSLELPTGTKFPARDVETALDRVTSLVQDLDEQISRSIKLPPQTSATTAETVNPEDDKILAWDGTTGLLKNGPTTASFESATNTAVAAAATATTQAGIATTQAGISTSKAVEATGFADLAESWAIDPIGDRPEGSSKYWSELAEGYAAALNIPVLGAANTVLRVNGAGDALEYGLVAPANMGSGAATAGQVLTANGSGGQSYADLVVPDPGWVPIKTVVAADVATVDFINGADGVVFDGTYKSYVFVFRNLTGANDGVALLLRTTTNAADFDSGSTDYQYNGFYVTLDAITQNDSTGDSAIILGLGSVGAGNQAGESMSGIIYFSNPADSTVHKNIKWDFWGSSSTSGTNRMASGNGNRLATTDIDGFRLLLSSGNIATLTGTLYGLADA